MTMDRDDSRDQWVATLLTKLLEEGLDEDGHFRVYPQWEGSLQNLREFNMTAVLEYMQIPIRECIERVVDDYAKESLMPLKQNV